jgi:uncharacterized membrane protein
MPAPPHDTHICRHARLRRLWRLPGRADPWLLAAAAPAIIPLLSLLRAGLPNTADGVVHLYRTWEVLRLWGTGTWYPRWAPDFYFGYGYPFFLFYPAGAHMLAGLLGATGLGVVGGLKAAEALAVVLYPTGAYLAARTLFGGPGAPHAGRSRAAALLCAALYLYAPLRWR